MSDVLANFQAIEGTGPATHKLQRKSRKLIIINDSGSLDLSYKFNESESFGTLKPTETISLYFVTNQVIISGNCDYRIWVYG